MVQCRCLSMCALCCDSVLTARFQVWWCGEGGRGGGGGGGSIAV